MNYYLLVISALIGLAVAVSLIPVLIRRAAARHFPGGPGAFHHAHRATVPRLGGVVFAVTFVLLSLAVFVFYPADETTTRTRVIFVCASLAMFLLGFWDDLRPLGAKKKLLGQVLIATVVCGVGISIEKYTSPFTGEVHPLGLWSWPVTILWLVGLTNMINLIDGMDGLAGGVSLMLMALLTYVGVTGGLPMPVMISAGMCGALIGFLRYNFPPARIYMGDGGAYLLGFLIALLTLLNSHKGTVMAALIAPLFALALPILDVSLAIVRRGLKGLPLFRPDRAHIHHKLVQMGFSSTRAVLVLYGLSSVFLLIAFAVFWSQGRWMPILFGLACLIVLLLARTFEFSRKWFAVGRTLESVVELRKESQYALTVARWLEMEAERAPSVEALWSDLVFMSEKMGFTRVVLELEDGTREWVSPGDSRLQNRVCRAHELGGDTGVRIEFCGDAGGTNRSYFDHICELFAEAWHNAAARWQTVNGQPVRFAAIAREGRVARILSPNLATDSDVKGGTPRPS